MKQQLIASPHQFRLLRRLKWGAVAIAFTFSALPCAAGTATAAPDQRLTELTQLAHDSNAAALDSLELQQELLTRGVSYATHLRYLKLLRQTRAAAGQLKQAYAVDTDIVRLATAQGDAAGIALGRLGSVSMHLDNNSSTTALATVSAIERDYPGLTDPEYLIALQETFGRVYNSLGQFDKSLKHYFAGIDVAMRHPEQWKHREAMLRIGVVRMYITAKNAEKALETANAIRRAEMSGASAATLDYCTGIALVGLGRTAQAQEAFRRGLAIAQEHGLRSRAAFILGNVSDAYLRVHQYPDAERAARAALILAEETSEQNAILMANANLGFALAGQGKVAEGLPYLNKVVVALRKTGALADMANMLAEMSQAQEAAKMYKEALATLRERESVTNELASNERAKAVAALQEQFDAQRRSAQIASLERDNRLKDVEIGNRTLRLAVTTMALVLALLASALVYALYRKSVRKSAQLKAMASGYEHDSLHDPLTELGNRRSFTEKMSARTVNPVPAGEHDCFTLIDIDHFKRVNDTYGHAAGDAVLVEVAKRLNSVIRGQDAVVRWGGEEFLIYSHAVDAVRRAAIVQRALTVIEQTPIALPNGAALSLTVSAGSVGLPFLGFSEVVFNWQQAIGLADRALYHSKQNGRNCGNIVEGVAAALPSTSSEAEIKAACDSSDLQLQLVLPHA